MHTDFGALLREIARAHRLDANGNSIAAAVAIERFAAAIGASIFTGDTSRD